jgi:hypothetical protein
MELSAGPVLVLGAGATRACNGPLTNEILLEADKAAVQIEREGYLTLLDRFLIDVFRLPPRSLRVKSSYPALPLLMSLIDEALDRGQPLHSDYNVPMLREVRSALDYAIFAVLEFKLRGQIPPLHSRAVDLLFPPTAAPRIISLNYDIIADNMLAGRTEMFPDYGCDIQTQLYRDWPKHGQLLTARLP